MSRNYTKEEFKYCSNKISINCNEGYSTVTFTGTCELDPPKPKPKLFELYWNASVSGWRLYGVWIKQKYWIGFAIVKEGS